MNSMIIRRLSYPAQSITRLKPLCNALMRWVSASYSKWLCWREVRAVAGPTALNPS